MINKFRGGVVFFFGVMVLVLVFSAPVRGEIVLDDFEDGSDGGWSVVGHGPLMGMYQKGVVSPGHASLYGLRLTKGTAEGWCGVGISSLGKLKLTRLDAIRLWARSGKDVTGLLVDVHLSDGTRWWYRPGLPADGSWVRIEARPENFFCVENPKKLPVTRPELKNIGTLWLTIDKVAEKSKGPWELQLDEVVLDGEGQTAKFAAVGGQSAKAPIWQGPKVMIGVLDKDAFLPVRPAVSVAGKMVKVLKASGTEAEMIAPENLGGQLDGGKIDILVLSGPAFCAGDDARVIKYLKAGRSLWYIGTSPIFSQPMIRRERKWEPAKKWNPDPELNWIFDGPVQTRHWLDLTEPEFRLTKKGREWWSGFPVRLPATKCGFLTANDSISWPCSPPWVEVIPILETNYVSRNWIWQDDTFTGWVMVKFAHRAGPFAGAKIIFAGLPDDPRSILHPGNPAFGPAVVKCAEELAKPVKGLWKGVPAAPLAGLPEITRKNFFTYPGPVFAPLNFGGFPVDDPVFWKNMDLAGFNAIHVSIPFLDTMNAKGEVVDWKRADAYVRAARDHHKKVIFDPYDFSWGRIQWTTEQSRSNPVFLDRFGEGMEKLAARYRKDPTVVATFAGPISVCYGSFGIDQTEFGKKGWQEYVQKTLGLSLKQASHRYGKNFTEWKDLPFPEHRKADRYNTGPIWADYLNFFIQSHHAFMRTLITRIRRGDPELPILMRGPYLDVSIHMKLAAEFPNVAPHCECVETTRDTEAYFRGPALSFGVPIGAENGWPKIRGGPLRMALADYLLGGYSYFLYSFGGPTFTRPGILDFYKTQQIARTLRLARYPATSLGLLIPDTTLYASESPSFFSMEGLPHLEFEMERFGFNFRSVSAQFPDFTGLKILIDDGSNFVLTPECRKKIADWVRQGGTLIAFPETGKYDLAGGAVSLEKELGTVFGGQDKKGRMEKVGKGEVVIFSKVPEEKDELSMFENYLVKFEARRDVVVTPHVNNACFRNGEKTYLVLCNKSADYVGSYFKESRLPAAEARLPNLELKVKPNFVFKRARDLATGKDFEIQNGTCTVHLPRTEFTVIEFDR